MTRYILFSKTNWTETPRLRHQIALLLKRFGNEVVFFQKPRYPWQRRISEITEPVISQRSTQLIHHQLRLFEPLAAANAIAERFSIGRLRDQLRITGNDIILNFNYDYYFLRDLFPSNKMLTIINDDFVAQSRFRKGKHALRSLRTTCRRSDEVLVVSYPLARQVSGSCKPNLFFPWADVEYKHPSASDSRNKILLWAHIDGRIDFELLTQAANAANKFSFYVVGPVAEGVQKSLEQLTENVKNIHLIAPRKLDELELDHFFVSIIPYRKGVGDIEAVTMSNKSLQLMARGLPLITYGMPEFYEHPAIRKANDVSGFLEGLDYFHSEFYRVQPDIENLISISQARNRYEQLLDIVGD